MQEVALASLAALALFLVVGTVASDLALPLVVPDAATPARASPRGAPEAEVFLDVTVHHVERRLVNGTGGPGCQVVRTLSDKVAPVLLLDHGRDDATCAPYEEIEVLATADSETPGRLVRFDLDLCTARSFSTTGDTADGVRLTSVELGPCETPRSLFFPPIAPEGFAQVMAYPHEVPGEGLLVVCAAVEIAFDDGTRRVFQDMAWFEAWPSLERFPNRTAVRESKDPNVGCTHQGLDWRPALEPFPDHTRGPPIVVRDVAPP